MSAGFRDSEGSQGNRTRVLTPQGTIGWCFGAYLRPYTPPATAAQTSAPVQSSQQEAAPQSSGPLQPQPGDYANILNGDLSAFAGYWVNGKYEEIYLHPNGAADSGSEAGGFARFDRGHYSWRVSFGDSRISAALYPAGVAVQLYGETIQTDTAKIRLYLRGRDADPVSEIAAKIFYRESDAGQ